MHTQQASPKRGQQNAKADNRSGGPHTAREAQAAHVDVVSRRMAAMEYGAKLRLAQLEQLRAQQRSARYVFVCAWCVCDYI
jgi:hypothetical protein